MKKTALLSLLILSILGGAYAGTPKEGLMQAPGARASAMAGAFCAVADDYSAYFWNPAGLVFVRAPLAGVYGDSVFKASEFSLGLAYAQPVPLDMSAGISVMKNFYSDSNFGKDLYYLSLAFYTDDEKRTAFGANMKFIHSYIIDYETWGFAPSFDFGMLYFPEILDNKIRAGIMIRDINTTIVWNNNTREKMPAVFRAGAAYIFDKSALAAFDFEASVYGENGPPARASIHLGGEKKFYVVNAGEFGLRAGFNWKEAVNPNYKIAFGLSYARKEFAVNYAFVPDALGDTHKFDLGYIFGEEEQPGKKRPETETAEKKEGYYAEVFKNVAFEISARHISPNNDTRNDTVQLLIKNLPEREPSAAWKIEIKDAEGKTVRELGGGSAIPASTVWDGAGMGNRPLPDGDYTVVLAIEAEGAKVYEKARVISLDTTVPSFRLAITPKYFAPHPRSRVNKMEISVNAQHNDAAAWVMAVKDAKDSIIRRFSGEGTPPKLIWDGEDALGNRLMDGEYTINFALRDFAGNVFEQSEKFTVDTYISRFLVEPESRLFTAGKSGVVFRNSERDSDRVRTWDLEIRNRAGKIVAVFSGRSPAVRSVTWNGADENNVYVRSGSPYYYTVRVNQKNGIVIETTGMVQSALPEFEGTGIELTLAAVDFAAGGHDLPPGEYAYLNQAAEAVKQYAKNYNLFIKGYATDTQDKDKNLELSFERIKAIADYLVSQAGVPAENIYTFAIGDGRYFPSVEQSLVKKNARRVEIELMTK